MSLENFAHYCMAFNSNQQNLQGFVRIKVLICICAQLSSCTFLRQTDFGRLSYWKFSPLKPCTLGNQREGFIKVVTVLILCRDFLHPCQGAPITLVAQQSLLNQIRLISFFLACGQLCFLMGAALCWSSGKSSALRLLLHQGAASREAAFLGATDTLN